VTASEGPLPSLADIESEIQSFIRDVLLDDEYIGDDPLADLNIDSLALEQLLDHLEVKYLILFDPEEISRPNLATVNRLAVLVDRRLAAVAERKTPW
jgi:acyl carrier protein